mgnify:CR=1 FL=1
MYAFRIMRLPLLDAGGAAIGRLDDIVVTPGVRGDSPRVLGFTATSQRRRIFVNIGRVGTLDADGARLRSSELLVEDPLAPDMKANLIVEFDPCRRDGRARRICDLGWPASGIAKPVDQCAPQREVDKALARHDASVNGELLQWARERFGPALEEKALRSGERDRRERARDEGAGREHMKKYGTTKEQLAKVAVKNRRHAGDGILLRHPLH